MLRYMFLILFSFAVAFGEKIDLLSYEKSVYSEHGEDGILAKIFELIPPESRFCIEFGAYDGRTGSNTFLLRRQGWNCLLLDRMYADPSLNLYKEFIRSDNINEIFERYNVPKDLDLLSIDVDYNDFHLWNALSSDYRPKVVIIEYNPTHLPTQDKVVKYRPFYCGDGTNYYGASMLALHELGRAKGYSLVYAESSGTNLFFVRDDLIEKYQLEFADSNQVEKLYRQGTYGLGPNNGHRADGKQRPYFPSQDFIRR